MPRQADDGTVAYVAALLVAEAEATLQVADAVRRARQAGRTVFVTTIRTPIYDARAEALLRRYGIRPD